VLLLTCPSFLQVWSVDLFTKVISTLGNITEACKLCVSFFIISFHLPIELLRHRTHHSFSAILIRCSSIQATFSPSIVCPTTGPLSLRKRVIHRVRSRASSFNLQTGKFTLLDSFTLEDGTNMLSRKVGNQLPIYATQNARRAQI